MIVISNKVLAGSNDTVQGMYNASSADDSVPSGEDDV
jgi:hypothetical protein